MRGRLFCKLPHRAFSPRRVSSWMFMQPNAVACSITSSHEDLHEMTSISSCVTVNSQSVASSVVSQRMDLCLEFRSTTTVRYHQYKHFQYMLVAGLCILPSPILKMDRSITTFGSVLAFVTMFSTNLLLSQCSDCISHFSHFSTIPKLHRKSWYSASFPWNDGGLPRPPRSLSSSASRDSVPAVITVHNSPSVVDRRS